MEVESGHFVETTESGKPVVGTAEIRGGLIEKSNVDFKANISYYQQAKMQMEMTNKLISTNKQILQSALELLSYDVQITNERYNPINRKAYDFFADRALEYANTSFENLYGFVDFFSDLL